MVQWPRVHLHEISPSKKPGFCRKTRYLAILNQVFYPNPPARNIPRRTHRRLAVASTEHSAKLSTRACTPMIRMTSNYSSKNNTGPPLQPHPVGKNGYGWIFPLSHQMVTQAAEHISGVFWSSRQWRIIDPIISTPYLWCSGHPRSQ